MGLYIVLELRVQDMRDLLLQPLILDREDNLDTLVEVSRHPVRGAHVELIVPVVVEPENSRVLKEISDD